MNQMKSIGRFVQRALLANALLLLVTGCPKKQPQPADEVKQPASPATPAQFGPAPARITFVNEQLKFVVINVSSRAMPASGTILQVTRGTARVGAVRVSEERRARFITADIIDGELHIGDEAH